MFPITVAMGKAFCNRVSERKVLAKFIQHGRHAVLIAPRRYGKTSLIYQVLSETKLPHAMMDLTFAITPEDVESIIHDRISELLYSILPRASKAKQQILKLFSWLNPEVVLTAAGQKVIFHPRDKQKENPILGVSEVLKKLDEAARVVNKRLVVVMDEFQQISEIDHQKLEASIRSAMQVSTHITYIFSGSHRRLLQEMFNDDKRSFYNSCEIIQVKRIHQSDYAKFIEKASQARWKKSLSKGVFEKIMQLTERHPSYVNRVCGYFWMLDIYPSVAKLTAYWQQFIDSKRAEFTSDILALSKNQRILIKRLAHHPTKHVTSAEVCHAVGLSESSVRQSYKSLLDRDFLYLDEEGMVRILDPAMRDFIKEFPQK